MAMSTAAYTEAWLSGPQKTRFYTRTYKPEEAQLNAAVVFVHGFIEHIGRYEHVFPAWSVRGIAVFAYDQRGFGRTALDEKNRSKNSAYGKTSWREQLEDIEWAINHVKQEFGGAPIFLYGHSMVGPVYYRFCDKNHLCPATRVVHWLWHSLLGRTHLHPKTSCLVLLGLWRPAHLFYRHNRLQRRRGGLVAKLVAWLPR